MLLDFSNAATEYRNLKPIYAGKNSRVYKAWSIKGSPVAVKHYFRHPSDKRDRLLVEFESLTYLQNFGINNIPIPLDMNREFGWAVYNWIEGCTIPAEKVTINDIDQAVNFLYLLKIISRQTEQHRFAPASEACFSMQSLKETIDHRIASLQTTDKIDSEYSELLDFFQSDLLPFYHHLIKLYCNSKAVMNWQLEKKFITLSPSDFGFHNAIKNDVGLINFLDFEYFGWDDPAKIISDFCLHPAMNLSSNLFYLFLSRCLDLFKNDPHLKNRLSVLFPFYGIKWCLILLNEFLPYNLSRRRFSSKAIEDATIVRRRQLNKSRNMFQRIKNDSLQTFLSQ